MIVQSPTRQYEVGDCVAETETYRLYLCEEVETKHQYLLQIATDTCHNGALDRNAFILTELKRQSDRLEAEYAKVKGDPEKFLNYHLGFPLLVESFISEEQGGRRMTILCFSCVEEVRKMVPLSNVIYRDQLRVDLRTSAWIMGKSLKLLAFAHGVGVTVGRLDPANILIEPEQHYVVFFDLSQAQMHAGTIPQEQAQEEIAEIAQSVIALLGCDSETGIALEEEKDKGYVDNLLNLAEEGQQSAQRAYERFYQLVDATWERKFYPFTTYRR